MLQAIGLVMLGASVGAVARFLVTHFSSELFHHHGFPYGTLIVNAAGSLLVGYILTWTSDHEHDYWRLLMATGFCGGFTTFSAFAYESMTYLHQGKVLAFGFNMLLNNLVSFAAVLVGIRLHERVN